jgi:uncharacterized protein YcnI
MRRLVAVLLAVGLLLVAGVASAHVTVWPKESQANGYERFTVRVPNEKDNPTVKVRVVLPAGATFSGVLPVAGWKFDAEKDAAGHVTALIWSGGEIKPGEFMEFGVSLKNPKEPGNVTFKAYQTYSDGTVVNWEGPAGADQPAPTVHLSAAPAAGDTGHGETAPAPAPVAAPEPKPASPWAAPGTWLGGGALLVSLLALVLSLRKR